MWFWFAFGFIIAVIGIVLMSIDACIEIKNICFNTDILGEGLATIGGVLSGVMFVCIGVMWLFAQK